jgi:arylsulfatase A-like enzyme
VSSPVGAAPVAPGATSRSRRVLFALAGGAGGSALVAAVEAGVARAGEEGHAPAYGAVFLADVGVLAPIALLVALFVALSSLFLEPERARWIGEHLDEIRARPVLHRTRTAALAPLAVLGALAWCVIVANVARTMFAQGAALTVGVTLGAASLAIAGLVAVVVLVLVRPLRRALAFSAQAFPILVDPVATGAFAGGIAIGVIAIGVALGDTGGGGAGGARVLAIFGVLKRSELDLRPLANLIAIAMGAYLAIVALAARRSLLAVAVALALVVGSVFVTLREARALNADETVARALTRGAPLGKIALSLVRRATDRDRDGASPWFGGGDCDDRDARRSPLAIEIPDNGIDEDCSGADLHLTKARVPSPLATDGPSAGASSAPTVVRPRVPSDLNVVVITIDTLRTDLGFMGYPKDTSPNLDRLAEKSVVFDRMYAMASYTGKSIGPLFIGKYPSETKRDGGHFNTYLSGNTFLAERLKEAGIHTLGAASHWYFEPWSGLSQGFETWDLRAMPADGQGDNDTSVTSKELSDAAIRLLKKPESTAKRFFMWIHYFDPHEQYMPHDDAPDFGGGSKAAYDAEVWFTDKHVGRVLDFIASQPWGARTSVIVTADHGEAFGEHNMHWHGYELWEPLVRVPFVVYVPGVAPHHVPVKRSHVDFVPTVLDLMSVWRPAEGELSGESMIDDIIGGHPLEERDVYIDMPIGPFTPMRHALIHGTTPGMKLIHLDSGEFQLFDLKTDPDEKEDLSNNRDDKAKLDEMIALFRAKRGSLKEIDVKPLIPTTP